MFFRSRTLASISRTSVVLRPIASFGNQQIQRPIEDTEYGEPRVLCVHHNRTRLARYMTQQPDSSWVCKPTETCHPVDGTSQHHPRKGYLLCSIHNRRRWASRLKQNSDGSWQCTPETPCSDLLGLSGVLMCVVHGVPRPKESLVRMDDVVGVFRCSDSSPCQSLLKDSPIMPSDGAQTTTTSKSNTPPLVWKETHLPIRTPKPVYGVCVTHNRRRVLSLLVDKLDPTTKCVDKCCTDRSPCVASMERVRCSQHGRLRDQVMMKKVDDPSGEITWTCTKDTVCVARSEIEKQRIISQQLVESQNEPFLICAKHGVTRPKRFLTFASSKEWICKPQSECQDHPKGICVTHGRKRQMAHLEKDPEDGLWRCIASRPCGMLKKEENPKQKCGVCGERGHFSRNCSQRKCRLCHELGHYAAECTKVMTME